MHKRRHRFTGRSIKSSMAKLIKVLLISHAYVAPENRRKLECLAEIRGLEVGVVFPSRWPTKHGGVEEVARSGECNDRGYRIFAIDTFLQGNGARYFYRPIGLIKAWLQFKPQIVHLEEEPWSWVALEIALLNLFLRKKLILFTWENLEVPMGFLQRLIEKFVLRQVDLVIAGSCGAKERIERRGFGGRVEILPQFGVDPKVFKLQEGTVLKKKLGIEGFVVGFVGRLVEEKGIGTLLEAVSKIEDASILLVSTSPRLPDEFSKLAKDLGVDRNLVLATGVLHQDLPKHLSLMDVLVLPSKTTPIWKEQFGRVLIEAMACQVPVIGSSSGTIPEVIGDAGLIFKEGNALDLQAKIEQLKSSPKVRQELAQKGYQRVLDNYTFEKIASETSQVYSVLLRT